MSLFNRIVRSILSIGGASNEIRQYRETLVKKSNDTMNDAWHEVGQFIGNVLGNDHKENHY